MKADYLVQEGYVDSTAQKYALIETLNIFCPGPLLPLTFRFLRIFVWFGPK